MRGREEIFITDEAWSVKATLFAFDISAWVIAVVASPSCSLAQVST